MGAPAATYGVAHLVVHVALRVSLDLHEPLDVDVLPVGGDRALGARARAASRLEWLLGGGRLALGDGEPYCLVARRRVVDGALGRERRALLDGGDEVGRLLAIRLVLRARKHLHVQAACVCHAHQLVHCTCVRAAVCARGRVLSAPCQRTL